MNRKIVSCFGIMMVMMILAVQTTFAASGYKPFNVITSEQGSTITNAVIDDFITITGDTVKVQHNILGTTIITGNNVEVDSDIDGDAIILGRYITFRGKVDGNLYMAGESLDIKGNIIRDAFLFGKSVILEKESVLGRDANIFAADININGEIKRDLITYSEKYNLFGRVGRNSSVSAEDITIANGALVGGDFNYQSDKNALIGSGAKINGSVQKHDVEKKAAKAPTPFKFLWDILFTLGVAAVFWAVLLLVAPRLLEKFSLLLAKRPGSAAGYGAIALATCPIAVIILLCTFIGIPLAIILGLVYAMLLYLAFYISAGALGIVMFKNVFKQNDLHKDIWYILAGVLAVKILTMVPFVGWVFGLASVVFGFGLVILMIAYLRKKQV